jgi:deazaflavin-dependent oxidoreductase (nitroreductase family)
MTDVNMPSAREPIATAHTLPLQGLVNGFVRALLRVPLVSRLAGRRLITVYPVGRKSGRLYAVPVAYTRLDESLLVGSQFAWIRNLQSGEPVEIRLAGRKRLADVRVLEDEPGVVEHLALMAGDNHQFAKFNRIRLDRGGNPLPADLHLAWAAGARIAVLTPR